MRELCIKFRCFLDEERGSFGIKEIAATIGAIILVGIILAALDDNMNTIVTETWAVVKTFLENITKE